MTMRNYHRYFSCLLTGSLAIAVALPTLALNSVSVEKRDDQAIAVQQLPMNPDLPQQLPTASISETVARRVKRDAAKRFNIPVSRLRIAAAQPRTWDGCFGLPKPDGVCTQIAIPGWQVVVSGVQRSWVYHASADGRQLQVNETASLTQRSPQIRPSFLPEDVMPDFDEQLVFQTVEEGGIAGRTVITRLNREGIVTRQTIAPNIRSTPVIIKKLKPEQVTPFVEQVRQQRFNHLSRLRYLPHRGADWITTQIIAEGTVVEFADIAPNQLPTALQQVMRTWRSLIQA